MATDALAACVARSFINSHVFEYARLVDPGLCQPLV